MTLGAAPLAAVALCSTLGATVTTAIVSFPAMVTTGATSLTAIRLAGRLTPDREADRLTPRRRARRVED